MVGESLTGSGSRANRSRDFGESESRHIFLGVCSKEKARYVQEIKWYVESRGAFRRGEYFSLCCIFFIVFDQDLFLLEEATIQGCSDPYCLLFLLYWCQFYLSFYLLKPCGER